MPNFMAQNSQDSTFKRSSFQKFSVGACLRTPLETMRTHNRQLFTKTPAT